MQRERHVAVWLRMLAEGEIRLSRSAKRLFKAQGSRAKSSFKESNSVAAVIESIRNGRKDWQHLLMTHYVVTINHLHAYTRIQLTGKSEKKNFGTRIQEFVTKQGLKNSVYITDTTIDKARKIINDGQQNGDSENDIANALEDGIGGAVSDSRAQMIARTETHNAATFAMQETAEEVSDQTGMSMTREWVAVEDDRTREAHSQADGQIVGLDEPFEVDGEELDRPGDPSGSEGNIINCRCTLIYHVIDASGNESDTTDEGDDAVGTGGFVGEN